MVVAIVNRAQRLAGSSAAATELDEQQSKAARHQIERVQKQLHRIDEEIQSEKKPHVEPSATHHDSGTECAAREQTGRSRGCWESPAWRCAKSCSSNSTTLPELHRTEKAEPHRQQILELFDQCQGNLVRVHEELVADGAELSYTALTASSAGMGTESGYAPPVPAGRYDFAPGEELQHDTSPPHEARTGRQEAQSADRLGGAVLFADAVLPSAIPPSGASIARFFSPRRYATSAARRARTMIDNTHVVVLRGSGRDMVPVPEMAAFGERFGFQFCGARDWECKPFGARRAAFLVHRDQLSGRAHLLQLGRI